MTAIMHLFKKKLVTDAILRCNNVKSLLEIEYGIIDEEKNTTLLHICKNNPQLLKFDIIWNFIEKTNEGKHKQIGEILKRLFKIDGGCSEQIKTVDISPILEYSGIVNDNNFWGLLMALCNYNPRMFA